MNNDERDLKFLKSVMKNCMKIDRKEVSAIFYSSVPSDFLDAFMSMIEKEILKNELRTKETTR